MNRCTEAKRKHADAFLAWVKAQDALEAARKLEEELLPAAHAAHDYDKERKERRAARTLPPLPQTVP